MSNTVQAQHPAVVLRSSYQLVRTLLAIATIAILGLTVAVVVLAINNGTSASASPAARVNPKAITSNAIVQPNPDERGLTASPLGSNIYHYYPGHR
jgi:ABC-type lipoprotein release transport system permease subunit